MFMQHVVIKLSMNLSTCYDALERNYCSGTSSSLGVSNARMPASLDQVVSAYLLFSSNSREHPGNVV